MREKVEKTDLYWILLVYKKEVPIQAPWGLSYGQVVVGVG